MPNTPNFSWPYPVVGADLDVWGDIINSTGILIDAEVFKKANISNPVFTGAISAPAFIGTPSAILRPTVDSATAIQFQNAAGVAVATIDTPSGQITAPMYRAANSVILRSGGANSGGQIQLQRTDGAAMLTIDTSLQRATFSGSVYVSSGIVGYPTRLFLSVTVDSTDGIVFQDSFGVTAAQIDTLNKRVVAAAGGVQSPLYTAAANVVLRPGADGANAFQFQNAAGAIKASINTIDGTISTVGFVSAGGYVGNPVVILQPITDGANAIRFVNAAGAIVASINTSGQYFYAGGAVSAPVYTAATDVILRPSVNSVTGIQFHNTAATPIAVIDTINNALFVGANPGYRGVLTVTGNGSLIDTGAGIYATAMFRSVGTAGVLIVETQGNPNASGARRGIGWSPGVDDLFISRFPASGAAATHDMYVASSGFVGIGTTGPASHLQVSGPGTAETITYTPSQNTSNAIIAMDTVGGGGNGGALVLGANGSQFCAIRGYFINGSNQGVGDMRFYVRTALTNAQLAEVAKFDTGGRFAVHAMPNVNPGAGTHILWADPADGYRIKWAV